MPDESDQFALRLVQRYFLSMLLSPSWEPTTDGCLGLWVLCKSCDHTSTCIDIAFFSGTLHIGLVQLKCINGTEITKLDVDIASNISRFGIFANSMTDGKDIDLFITRIELNGAICTQPTGKVFPYFHTDINIECKL